jgi:hypothetical protein
MNKLLEAADEGKNASYGITCPGAESPRAVCSQMICNHDRPGAYEFAP